MTDHLVLSDPLISGLIDLGISSAHCSAFTLVAQVGEPIVLSETRFVTQAEAEHLAANIEITDTYSPESTHP